MPEPGGDDEWITSALAEGLFDSVEVPAPTHRAAPPPTHRLSETADEIPVANEMTEALPSSVHPVAVVDEDVDWSDEVVAEHDSVSDDVGGAASQDTEDDNGVDDDAIGSFAKAVGEWIVVLVGAIAVALILRATLFQAFFIPSESMEMTLLEDDRVLVNKVSYRIGDINVGDVVVFRRPDNEPGEIRDLIKRVIATPGQTVEGRENSVWINGQRLEEGYLADDEVILDFGPVTVEEGELFVMGDNRDESLDSRFFGPIDEERVVGRAFVIFWPVNRLGWL